MATTPMKQIQDDNIPTKKIVAVVFGLAVFMSYMTVAFTQEQRPPSRDYILTLSSQDIAAIANALAARPFSEVNGIFLKLNEQVEKQNKAAVSAQPDKSPAAKSE